MSRRAAVVMLGMGQMSRLERVKRVISEKLDDPYSLLALRILFPPDWVAVPIEDEIADLYTYPERLEASYADEWRRLATRTIFEQAFADSSRSDEESLQSYVCYLLQEAIPRCMQRHPALFDSLEEILEILNNNDTLTFPDPSRRALMRMIWPEKY